MGLFDNRSILVKDTESNEYKYYILFSYISRLTNKSVFAITHYDIDNDDNIIVNAIYYNPNKKLGNIDIITDDREWKRINKYISWYGSRFKRLFLHFWLWT